MSRAAHLDRFYALLDQLADNVGGQRQLRDCTGRLNWPDRGVYFFFAPDERRNSSDHHRCTRIGTHAVSTGSQTTLWNRLRTHRGAMRGTYADGGNHRGSVFRKEVGLALIARHGLDDEYPHWGVGSSAGRDRRLDELALERRVSEYIRSMPFLWVRIDDEPGPGSDRAYVERNAIRLVSNFEREAIDPRSREWLGSDSPNRKIRQSGLWNVDHVDEEYDRSFLDRLSTAVEETEPP